MVGSFYWFTYVTGHRYSTQGVVEVCSSDIEFICRWRSNWTVTLSTGSFSSQVALNSNNALTVQTVQV